MTHSEQAREPNVGSDLWIETMKTMETMKVVRLSALRTDNVYSFLLENESIPGP